jgi:hypothetical protein
VAYKPALWGRFSARHSETSKDRSVTWRLVDVFEDELQAIMFDLFRELISK